MSADNWAVCPRCMSDAKKDLEALAGQVSSGYGWIPLDQFDRLRAKLAEGIDENALTTFREDYEIYGADEGVVRVSYSGRCQKCGIELSFEDARPFWPAAEQDTAP